MIKVKLIKLIILYYLYLDINAWLWDDVQKSGQRTLKAGWTRYRTTIIGLNKLAEIFD